MPVAKLRVLGRIWGGGQGACCRGTSSLTTFICIIGIVYTHPCISYSFKQCFEASINLRFGLELVQMALG